LTQSRTRASPLRLRGEKCLIDRERERERRRRREIYIVVIAIQCITYFACPGTGYCIVLNFLGKVDMEISESGNKRR
jgi:hypothetical protein